MSKSDITRSGTQVESAGTTYRIDRAFFEKVMAMLNHSTLPVMKIFEPGQRKMRITLEYDPREEKVQIQYFTEDIEEPHGDPMKDPQQDLKNNPT